MDGTQAHHFVQIGSELDWPCQRGCGVVFHDPGVVIVAPNEERLWMEDPEWVEEMRSLGVDNGRYDTGQRLPADDGEDECEEIAR